MLEKLIFPRIVTQGIGRGWGNCVQRASTHPSRVIGGAEIERFLLVLLWRGETGNFVRKMRFF